MWNNYYDIYIDKKGLASNEHRKMIGGMWEEIGQLQFDYLIENGLKPSHKFLDVGCGALRGGVKFIPYLDDGNYYGIDLNESILQGGIEEIVKNNILKKPNLLVDGEFNFCKFNQKFDYAIAQSVFTHLPLNLIQRCLINIDKVLKPNGCFYVTFFESKDKHRLEEIVQSENIISHIDKDPYHYHISIFEWMVQGLDLEFEYIGEWNHPRNQKMICFKKTY